MPRPEITCIADLKCAIGEGLFWDDATQALYFVDIPAGRLYRRADGDGALTSWSFDEPLGCLALDRSGRAVLALKSGIARVDLDSGERTAISGPEPGRPQNRYNDGAIDRQGRFWIGSMKMDPPAERSGAFYRLDNVRSVDRVFDGYYTTSGLAFSPNGRTMYLSDSYPDVRTIWAYDYDPADGVPSNKRVFFDTRAVAGRPDGATVDANGCYWMAGVSGWQLVRLTPAGRIDRVVDVPVEKPSRPAFGGPRLDVLYFTSLRSGLAPGSEKRQPQAGGVFAVHGLGQTGLAQPRFAG
jgi:sugar lactone lactonase YvrE